jgi:hypothetical protein
VLHESTSVVSHGITAESESTERESVCDVWIGSDIFGLWTGCGRVSHLMPCAHPSSTLYSPRAEISEISWLLGFPRCPCGQPARAASGVWRGCKLHARWLHNKTPAL